MQYKCSAQPQFDIDLGDLEKRYKRLQVRLHPDRFATMSHEEKTHSADQAAAVNQAYDVLRKPLKRAHYMVRHVLLYLTYFYTLFTPP